MPHSSPGLVADTEREVTPIPNPITRISRDQTWDAVGQLIQEVERVEDITEEVHGLVVDAVMRSALANNNELITAKAMGVGDLIRWLRQIAHQQASIIRLLLNDLVDVDPIPPGDQPTVIPSPNVVALQGVVDALTARVVKLETELAAHRAAKLTTAHKAV